MQLSEKMCLVALNGFYGDVSMVDVSMHPPDGIGSYRAGRLLKVLGGFQSVQLSEKMCLVALNGFYGDVSMVDVSMHPPDGIGSYRAGRDRIGSERPDRIGSGRS